MSIQNVEVKKNIEMFVNSGWTNQPHLDFLYNICNSNQMWFDYHVKKMSINGTSRAGGYTFRLVKGK